MHHKTTTGANPHGQAPQTKPLQGQTMFKRDHRTVRELDAAVAMLENRFRDVSAGNNAARTNAADAVAAAAKATTAAAEVRGEINAKIDAVEERLATAEVRAATVEERLAAIQIHLDDLVGQPVALDVDETSADAVVFAAAEDQPAAAEPPAPAEPSPADDEADNANDEDQEATDDEDIDPAGQEAA